MNGIVCNEMNCCCGLLNDRCWPNEIQSAGQVAAADFSQPIGGGWCAAIKLGSFAFCDGVAWFSPFVVIIIKLYNEANIVILA